ncbi:hypothetical protein C5B42_06005, partial [Candidatus Cerribacteria bacterium 'Amazon FNV 2010 28 9']
SQLLEVLKEEINVKDVKWETGEELVVELDTTLTPQLIAEGQMRDVLRTIQDMRKAANVRVDEYVDAWLPTWPKDFTAVICKKTFVRELQEGEARVSIIA